MTCGDTGVEVQIIGSVVISSGIPLFVVDIIVVVLEGVYVSVIFVVVFEGPPVVDEVFVVQMPGALGTSQLGNSGLSFGLRGH